MAEAVGAFNPPCRCACHRADVMHMVPCCSNTYRRWENGWVDEVDTVAEFEADDREY